MKEIKMNIQEIKKKMKKLEPFVSFYGQCPTLTKSNWTEYSDYIGLQGQLKGFKQGIKKAEQLIDDVEESSELVEIDSIKLRKIEESIWKQFKKELTVLNGEAK